MLDRTLGRAVGAGAIMVQAGAGCALLARVPLARHAAVTLVLVGFLGVMIAEVAVPPIRGAARAVAGLRRVKEKR